MTARPPTSKLDEARHELAEWDNALQVYEDAEHGLLVAEQVDVLSPE